MKLLHIEHALSAAGFTKKEIHTYFALLALGSENVSRIARKAGINRTTAYVILDSLIEKKVVTMAGKEPKQEYFAEPPESILAYLTNKIEEEKAALEKVSKVIPDLHVMHNKEDRPSVRFYEGKDGLKQVYEDTLTSSEPIRGYASVENMHEGLPGYFPEYYKRRTRKKIAVRAIIPSTKEGIERKEQDGKELRESALVPFQEFSFSPEINIYDNKVMIASWKEKLGIIIESKEISDAMKKIYELAWREAKRLDSKK